MKPIRTLFLLAGLLALNTACQNVAKKDFGPYIGPFYTVGNVYMHPSGLPDEIRRVAVLPLIPSRGNRDAERGIHHTQSVFTEEFSRNRRLDLVTVTPDRLQRMFGRRAFYADEPLPFDFLPRLQTETGCQAVLFAELTTFRAYPPVALGWKLHLFDLESEELIWAVDEVFDGGTAPVSNSMKRFIRQKHSTHGAAATELLVLDSPREMARFSLSEVIPTLVKKIPQVAVNPAESNNSQNVSKEPATVGPQPAPPPETPTEGIEEVPEPAKPVSDAI